MSLIRPIVRMITVAALRDRTWAQDRVFDSDNTPLVDVLLGSPAAKPYIVVFTDDDTRTSLAGNEVLTARRGMHIVIETGVAQAIEGLDGAGAKLRIPATDASQELAIDILENQIHHALYSDALSPWGEMFKLFVVSTDRINSVRGGAADKGSRWASRQITIITGSMAADLPVGVMPPEDHIIRDFIALARADVEAGLGQAADIIEKMLSPADYPLWRQDQGWLGLTTRGARSFGIAPILPPGDEEAEIAEEITLARDEEIDIHETPRTEESLM